MIKLILLFFVLYSSLYALDYTIETIFDVVCFENMDEPETSVNGEIMLYLLDEDNITADAAFKAGDDGNYFNRARIKLIRSWYDLAIGRQQIGWGNGYNLNPTDIYNAKPLGAAFDPSYTKRGRDCMIFTSYIQDFLSFEIIYAFRSENTTNENGFNITEETDWDLGGKLKTNLLEYDIALTYSYTDYRRRAITGVIEELLEPRKLAGLSLAGSLPVIDFGIWLEGVYDTDTEEYEFVTGSEYVFLEDYTLNIEYYRNSQGETKFGDYDLTRSFFGEMLGQDYLIPSLRYLVNEKLEIAAFSFINLNDNSTTSTMVFDYYYNDFLDFIITPFYINGPTESEFGMQSLELGEYGIDIKIRLII